MSPPGNRVFETRLSIRKNQAIDASFPSIDRNCDSRVISLIFIVSSLEISTWHLFIYLLFVSIWNLRFIPSTFRDAAAGKSGIRNAPRKNQVIDASFPSIDRNHDFSAELFPLSLSSHRNIHVAFIYLFIYLLFVSIWNLRLIPSTFSAAGNRVFETQLSIRKNQTIDASFPSIDRNLEWFSSYFLYIYRLITRKLHSKYSRSIYLFI